MCMLAKFPLLFCMTTLGLLATPGAAKTILDLQKNLKSYTFDGESEIVRFHNLNPNINKWYLLEVTQKANGRREFLHLENPRPNYQKVALTRDGALMIRHNQDRTKCQITGPDADTTLRQAKSQGKPFVSVCTSKLFVRNEVKGNRSLREEAVNFLRRNVWQGESIISFIKDTVYKDAELITAAVTIDNNDDSQIRESSSQSPKPALTDHDFTRARIPPGELGITSEREDDGQLIAGHWYRSLNNDAVFVSALQARMVAKSILKKHRNRALSFDHTEEDAMIYLVGFDLSDLEIGYATGSEHPEVTYSERTANRLRTKGWPGPDGIGSYAPLAATGMLAPDQASRVVATFTGGFKRKHSVFRVGIEATRNGGTHYGFMQNGVVFSTLYPGLATAMVDATGRFRLKTFTVEDQQSLPNIPFARQNGFPLVYRDATTGEVVPGEFVSSNFRGNWSGSKQNTVRALRTGMCLQTRDAKQFVIYGFFSSHTPNAMARVFQSYDCDYAMHLDMNMIIHTYLATYHRDESGRFAIEHVVKEMQSRDTPSGDAYLPRFVAVPDNRDFFYLLKKSDSVPKNDYAHQ